ncbi:MAG: hypothetical protein ARM1_0558 [Candidatus Micrarchaeota archaeon]|nr:MAG: hypothetical protein ARM1_0558 [Candidatus Micrarchaeota archaeon]
MSDIYVYSVKCVLENGKVKKWVLEAPEKMDLKEYNKNFDTKRFNEDKETLNRLMKEGYTGEFEFGVRLRYGAGILPILNIRGKRYIVIEIRTPDAPRKPYLGDTLAGIGDIMYPDELIPRELSEEVIIYYYLRGIKGQTPNETKNITPEILVPYFGWPSDFEILKEVERRAGLIGLELGEYSIRRVKAEVMSLSSGNDVEVIGPDGKRVYNGMIASFEDKSIELVIAAEIKLLKDLTLNDIVVQDTETIDDGKKLLNRKSALIGLDDDIAILFHNGRVIRKGSIEEIMNAAVPPDKTNGFYATEKVASILAAIVRDLNENGITVNPGIDIIATGYEERYGAVFKRNRELLELLSNAMIRVEEKGEGKDKELNRG